MGESLKETCLFAGVAPPHPPPRAATEEQATQSFSDRTGVQAEVCKNPEPFALATEPCRVREGFLEVAGLTARPQRTLSPRSIPSACFRTKNGPDPLRGVLPKHFLARAACPSFVVAAGEGASPWKAAHLSQLLSATPVGQLSSCCPPPRHHRPARCDPSWCSRGHPAACTSELHASKGPQISWHPGV